MATMCRLLALLGAGVGVGLADLPVATVLRGKRDARSNECQSWWSPMLIGPTKSNATLLLAFCKPGSQERNATPIVHLVKSTDAGRSFGTPITLPPSLGEVAYSSRAGAIVMLNQMGQEGANYAGFEARDSPCHQAMVKLCGPTAGKGTQCTQCEQHHAAALKAAGCTPKKLAELCGPPSSPGSHRPPPCPASNLNPAGPCMAADLPPPCADELLKSHGSVTVSTNEGRTWSTPKLIEVNNSLGPHYIGGGLNHGLELQVGKYAGRLAFARRFDDAHYWRNLHNNSAYMRSFVLFSDNGADGPWTAGQLLPASWTECQIAEMQNGSLLMSSRVESCHYGPSPACLAGEKRGFARSDDGGYTWAEIWYAPSDIPLAVCDQAICSDPTTEGSTVGTIYWAHPGNYSGDRSNYTVHRSNDGGGTWQFVNRVYGGGSGYSDAVVIPDPTAPSGQTLVMAFQKTWMPPGQCEGGGYDIGLARLQL